MSDTDPRRYRARLFGNALGPWRARRILAAQDAIDAGHGSREWQSGRFFLDEAVFIDDEPGEEPLPASLQTLSRALTLHARYGDAAGDEAVRRRTAAEGDEAEHWRAIVHWLRVVRAQADEQARREGGNVDHQ